MGWVDGVLVSAVGVLSVLVVRGSFALVAAKAEVARLKVDLRREMLKYNQCIALLYEARASCSEPTLASMIDKRTKDLVCLAASNTDYGEAANAAIGACRRLHRMLGS